MAETGTSSSHEESMSRGVEGETMPEAGSGDLEREMSETTAPSKEGMCSVCGETVARVRPHYGGKPSCEKCRGGCVC